MVWALGIGQLGTVRIFAQAAHSSRGRLGIGRSNALAQPEFVTAAPNVWSFCTAMYCSPELLRDNYCSALRFF